MDLTVNELYVVQLITRILCQCEPLKVHFIGMLKQPDQLKGQHLDQLYVLYKVKSLKELLNKYLKD